MTTSIGSVAKPVAYALTYVACFEITRAHRALFRRHERAFRGAAPHKRRVRDPPEMFLVPVEAPDLVLVDRVRGRGEARENGQREQDLHHTDATFTARHRKERGDV